MADLPDRSYAHFIDKNAWPCPAAGTSGREQVIALQLPRGRGTLGKRSDARSARGVEDTDRGDRLRTARARTKRVHQIEKPRFRPFPVRISEQVDLEGIDAL
jgi:hypothetical protein